MVIKNVKNPSKHSVQVHLIARKEDAAKLKLPAGSKSRVAQNISSKGTMFVNQGNEQAVVILNNHKNDIEKVRVAGSKLTAYCNEEKIKRLHISGTVNFELVLAFVEGLALSNYQFLKYFSDAKKRSNSLAAIEVTHADVKKQHLEELRQVVASVFETRNLVNEPQSYLTAVKLSEEIQRISNEVGLKVEVFNQSKIKALKMGGLLAVNQGSLEPTTFSIVEWCPKEAVNERPYVIVGKGVVYDTGGLSLKPTANSMDIMKCDMAGAAMMIGTMRAIAANNLPVNIICLIPATDNRPGGSAYAPGDVIKMYSGKTVEVLNTDAEGRMILADALAYASQYNPKLVLDGATLTGAAARAIGSAGIVAMGTADEQEFEELSEAGLEVYERIARFPFWEEYGDQIKSKIADVKNIGGPEGGAITAGKFLEHFTSYPYIHLDIAGPAWLKENSHYRTQGGSGVGVRLLYQFFKNKTESGLT